MRKLVRVSGSAPTSLSAAGSAASTEMAAATAYYGARVPWQATHTAYEVKQYKAADVKAALWKLAGGNCAYCESKISGPGGAEVEHYRPKGAIAGVAGHPGYWWLAHDWDNLLPACGDCNKSLRQHIVGPNMAKHEVETLLSQRAKVSHGKADQFDIAGTRAATRACPLNNENPLLIDPCRRDPANELYWDFSAELTLIHPKSGAAGPSPYGAYTIRTCALNRAHLVLDRIPALRPMRTIRTRLINRLNRWTGSASELADIIDEAKALASFTEPDQPFAGMAMAYVKDFEDELDRWRTAQGLPPF
jgi:5-methylcytosine-specific restriction endonuclease McrA